MSGITRGAIAAGERADRFDERLTPAPSKGDDLLALFLGTKPKEDDPPAETPEPSLAPMSLFASDIAYCETALHRLREKDRALRFETDVTRSVLTLDAPDDLRRRYGYFPREVLPENGRFALTADRNRMHDAIADSRRDETAWPTVHYLWRLNPVVGWLNDHTLVPLQELLDRTGLGREEIANRGRQADIDALQHLLPDAVAKAREWVVGRRHDFEERVNEKLNREMEGLEKLKVRQLCQLELQLEWSDQSETFKRAREERGRHDIETIFDEYLEWVQETMTTEPQPWIKVVCVMTGEREDDARR